MKFSADHRSLDYSSRFRAQVTQAHHKLRGIAWYLGTWNAAADRWNEEKKAKIGQ